jgi:hypothetical protein
MDESAAVARQAPTEPSEIGDLASFELFVDAVSARFQWALRLLTRDRAEAEDLMLEALLRSGSAGSMVSTTVRRSRFGTRSHGRAATSWTRSSRATRYCGPRHPTFSA